MAEKHTVNLSKQSLVQLQELLDRQNALIKNKKLIEHLKDKGASSVQLSERIQKEIQHRKDVEAIESSLSSLNLNHTKENSEILSEKHFVYVCSKEKPMQDTRYRPHRTLIHKEINTSVQRSPKKSNDVTSAFEPELLHEPTKCIPLAESLDIQNQQTLKLIEEQPKKALESFIVNNVDGEDSNDDKEPEDTQDATLEDS